MAKKKAGGRKTGKRGRGGRKPGSWTLLEPGTLRAWREQNNVSRSAVATMLGVSSTSVQNWETGHAVATAKMQQRLAELVQGAPSAPPQVRKAAVAVTAPGAVMDPALTQATAAIVVEAIRSNGKKGVATSDLGALIRTVRDALTR